jgi:uncharacterized membrane protein
MEWIVLVVLVILWFADRDKHVRRINALEDAVADLRRELADLYRAPPPASAPVEIVPPSPAAETPSFVQPQDVPVPAQSVDDGWRSESPPRVVLRLRDELQDAAQSQPQELPDDDREMPIVTWVRNYFTSGNLIVRVGVLVLFFGVAFLLKYAAEHSHVPITVRLTGVAVAALILLAVGWRLSERRPGYGLALQGGGIGILYLTVFAALRLYMLLPASGAFVLLAGIGIFSAILAVGQESMALAVLGIAGGFLAPVLTATEHGNHVVLFSYYAVLDVGVLGIAWFRAWRPLNLLAFVFTFGISALWGASHYRPELLPTTEPFLIVFFLMFVAIAVLFALRRAPELLHYVDGTLVFGTPVVVMGIQSALVHHIPYATAFSALALAAFYLILAIALMRWHRETLRLLIESALALAIAFVTLAIPLAVQGRLTAACWALEGVAILWIGLRQQRKLAVAAGVLLQFLAGIAYVAEESGSLFARPVVIVNSELLAAVIVSIGGFFASALMRTRPNWLKQWHAAIPTALFYWALLWWLHAGLREIQWLVPHDYQPSATLAYVAVAGALLSILAAKLDWAHARLPPLCLFPVLVVAVCWWLPHEHPSVFGGWWAWPIALGVGYATLKRNETTVSAGIQTALHVIGLWLWVGLLTWEAVWQVGQVGTGAWPLAACGVIPMAVLFVLPALARRGRWPTAGHESGYLTVAAAGITLYLCLWAMLTNVMSNGEAAPLPYVPLLNPLDVCEGLAIVAMVSWLVRLPAFKIASLRVEERRVVFYFFALIAFFWLNTMLLRAVNHWAQVPYEFEPMLASTLTQASLSLFWSVLALAAMMWSARRGHRLPWFCGATLMGIVVVKLFLFDLSHIGTVPRIVSFLGVGTLMLVLGYYSPLPPATKQTGT